MDTDTDRESDPEEDTDNNEDLCLYVKTIAQHSKCYHWFADSDASAHMTNKNEYFVGNRKRVMNRYVKVGGGRKIPVDSMDKAIIEIGDGKLILQKCLYVPGLKVNLLSTRRLCE